MGSLDPEKKTPMTKDGIFRIYSMTKPITTVAAMMLFEEGKLALERSGRQVHPGLQGREGRRGEAGPRRQADAGAGRAEAADDRPGPDAPQLRAHLRLLRRRRWSRRPTSRPTSATAIPTTPSSSSGWPSCRWSIQPGTTWDYSHVDRRARPRGRGRRRASRSIRSMKELLLDPLGMTDTSFYVTDPAKQARIAEPFANDRTIGAGAEFNDPRVAKQVRVRRRRHGRHGDGLRALPADARQRRHARRQALSGPQDHRLHGLRPHGRRRPPRAL